MEEQLLPKHIGIIMDGNGRWAKQRGLPRKAGHKAGADTFKRIAQSCKMLGIPYLTVYAFSTENWKRPKDEVDAIIELLRQFLKEAENNRKENVRTRFIGDLTPFDADLRRRMAECEEESRACTGLRLNIAVNYGGRDEIKNAVRAITREVQAGTLLPDEITEQTISDRLYTKDQPDVDLIIRPSGEQRISNFLLWQSAYAEYVFMDVLWPDFNEECLKQAINEYTSRNRRFGGI